MENERPVLLHCANMRVIARPHAERLWFQLNSDHRLICTMRLSRRQINSIVSMRARALYGLIAGLLLWGSGCTSFQLLDATIPRWGSTRWTNAAYGSLPRQKLDVYRPHGVAPGASIVIFFYGGDWQRGYKGGYRFVAQALASRGFIAVLPDYRLYPDVTFPAFVNDAALAVRWVHDHAREIGGDPSHIYLMGHSAGAHIVALLTLDKEYLNDVGLHRDAIRATVGLSGPYDFMPPLEDRGVFGMSLASTQPDPRIEPINFVDGKEPPMLLIQGEKDTTVNPSNAINLAARIREAGGSIKLILYPKADHVGVVLALAWPFRWIAPTLPDVTEFIRSCDGAAAAR